MNRRSALKQAAILAGGITWLPSCNFGPERVAAALNNLQIDLDHQNLLARVAEVIIPSGNTPGAETLDLHRFILVMVDDCLPALDQARFTTGLRSIVPFVKEHLQRSFPEKEPKANEEILTRLMVMTRSPEAPLPGLEDIQAFLAIAKQYTIQGYMASKYILTEKFPYKLVPGPFQACVSTEGLPVL